MQLNPVKVKIFTFTNLHSAVAMLPSADAKPPHADAKPPHADAKLPQIEAKQPQGYSYASAKLELSYSKVIAMLLRAKKR